MPKMKTNRGAAKRFKVTGTGKVRRMKAFSRHLKNCKSAKRRRNLRKGVTMDACDAKVVKNRMLPYS